MRVYLLADRNHVFKSNCSPVNPLNFSDGLPCILSTYNRSHSPVNPMRFRDNTSCFSLNGENGGTRPGELVRH